MTDTSSPYVTAAVNSRLQRLKENKALAEQTLATLEASREQLIARIHAHTGAIEQIEQVLSSDLTQREFAVETNGQTP